eukprot:UN01027
MQIFSPYSQLFIHNLLKMRYYLLHLQTRDQTPPHSLQLGSKVLAAFVCIFSHPHSRPIIANNPLSLDCDL